jgi:hypothetical protein
MKRLLAKFQSFWTQEKGYEQDPFSIFGIDTRMAGYSCLQARRQELLPTRYVHVVFTLPHELAPLALQNKKILYHLLLQTSAETLLEVVLAD